VLRGERLELEADVVAELLGRCPGVRVLATSREPLELDGELAAVRDEWQGPVGAEGRTLRVRVGEGLLARATSARLREALYDVVARNRFRIFGRSDVCYAPRPQYRDRFLA